MNHLVQPAVCRKLDPLPCAAPRMAPIEAARHSVRTLDSLLHRLALAGLALGVCAGGLNADSGNSTAATPATSAASMHDASPDDLPASQSAPRRPRLMFKTESGAVTDRTTKPADAQWQPAPDAEFSPIPHAAPKTRAVARPASSPPAAAAPQPPAQPAASPAIAGRRVRLRGRIQKVSAQAPAATRAAGQAAAAAAPASRGPVVSAGAENLAEETDLPPRQTAARYDDEQPQPLAPPQDADDIPRPAARPHKTVDDIPKNPLDDLAYVNVVPLAAEEYVIDLNNALQLAEINNPRIAVGREAIRLAMAAQLEARGMLLPTLNAGTMYHLHSGALQTSFGQVRTLNEQSIYFGGGSRTLAAETMAVPMVRIFANLGDAIFAPLAATRMVAVRNSDSTAIENANLLEVIARYMDLLAAESRLEAIRQSEAEIQRVVQATADFARTGLGRDGDYQRARADALLMHTEEQRAQESVSLASSNLARVLSLDPAIRLKTVATGNIEIVQLVDLDYNLDDLVNLALVARPEVTARGFDIAAAQARVQQEKARPLLPLVSVGYSAGGFGGGSNRQDLGVPSFYMATNTRTDIDVWCLWTLQNMGVGNLALQKQRSIERDQAVTQRSLLINQIRKDVTEAFALTQARRQQVVLARQRMFPAVEGVREELERIRGNEGLPIETLNSVEILATARQDLISAIVGYDLAQFQLFVALGQTPGASSPDPRIVQNADAPAAPGAPAVPGAPPMQRK